jgi:hypothetical protein
MDHVRALIAFSTLAIMRWGPSTADQSACNAQSGIVNIARSCRYAISLNLWNTIRLSDCDSVARSCLYSLGIIKQGQLLLLVTCQSGHTNQAVTINNNEPRPL